jgi:MoaA/NifB/PqqE/SkfB family radical SAM enzyme
MAQEFNLESYLSNGVENIVKGIIKATFANPKESIFMAKYALASKESAKLRKRAEDNGDHIPPFLIASITSKCNLHCAGCYARSNHACVDREEVNQLTSDEWLKIFKEAKDMGIGFILLAGGEPLIRKDIILEAGKIPEILFPVFTNGTLINDDYLPLFDKYRNLVPVLSIEGREETTDERRGEGVYKQLRSAMDLLKKNKILFGASVTVTTANINEVTSDEFLNKLATNGCKVVFFIEYVPVTKESKELAIGDTEREYLSNTLNQLRKQHENMVFISFPGDEKSSGGCLAAGRGFFHINSHGGAEPCPFSPYSDINVKDTSLREALKSKLFLRLKENNILMEDHIGGCILFEQKDVVEQFLSE